MNCIYPWTFLLAGFLLASCSRSAKVYGSAPPGALLTINESGRNLLNFRVHGTMDNGGRCILHEDLALPRRDSVVLVVRLDSSGHILLDTSLVFLRRNKEPFVWVSTSSQAPYGWIAAVGDDSETHKY